MRHLQLGESKSPNPQPAPDAAMSSCLHFKHHWRGPGEADGYAEVNA
jgi:hypothetical protein